MSSRPGIGYFAKFSDCTRDGFNMIKDKHAWPVAQTVYFI